MQNIVSYRDFMNNLIKSSVNMDLHIHTCYSDGELSPEEVVDRWEANKYEVIAITDHDGIKGSEIAFEYAKEKNITCIPGIEFDSQDDVGKDLHILGYGINFKNSELISTLNKIREWRDDRNYKLLYALNDLGYDIERNDVIGNSNGEYVGKPLFALALCKKGYVDKPMDAFSDIFKKYDEIESIKKEVLASSKVVDIIHKAGGLAVLAHPIEQRKKYEGFAEFNQRLPIILNKFLEYGIDGIECYHPSASKKQSEMLRRFAEENGLIVTRGSDFHADNLHRDFSRYYEE